MLLGSAGVVALRRSLLRSPPALICSSVFPALTRIARAFITTTSSGTPTASDSNSNNNNNNNNNNHSNNSEPQNTTNNDKQQPQDTTRSSDDLAISPQLMGVLREAESYILQKNYEQALMFLREALPLAPSKEVQSRIHARVARIYLQNHTDPKSLELADQHYRYVMDAPSPSVEHQLEFAECLYRQAFVLSDDDGSVFAKGDFRVSLLRMTQFHTLYHRLVQYSELDKDDAVELRIMYGDILYERAKLLFRRGMPDRAAADLSTMITENLHKSFMVYLWRAICNERMKNWPQVIRDADAVISLDPNVPDAFRLRIKALTSLGRHSELGPDKRALRRLTFILKQPYILPIMDGDTKVDDCSMPFVFANTN